MTEYNEQRMEFQKLKDDGTLDYLYKGQSILSFKPIALTTHEREELKKINYLIDIRKAKEALSSVKNTLNKYKLMSVENTEYNDLYSILEELDK